MEMIISPIVTGNLSSRTLMYPKRAERTMRIVSVVNNSMQKGLEFEGPRYEAPH